MEIYHDFGFCNQNFLRLNIVTYKQKFKKYE